jgi:crotonobetainyl-CoA:carnitine CoA-transferase CaiB-like acyl-CoA transferase
MPGALSHIRVLDLSRVLAGPWCTQNLADLGADVIKVERPGVGDDTRRWGPPWLKLPDGTDSADSTYYAAANRGKQYLTLNLAAPQGQALARELAASCDVVVENYKVGDLARYGLDYASLRTANPGLVYCSITGYGQDGPSAHKPGYDFVFQALGGMMSITGERDDRPGGGPQKLGIALADVMTGMYATVAILAALTSRSVTGVGQYIDMALLDSVVAVGGNQAVGYLATGVVPHRYGNEHVSLVPYQVFATADDDIVVAIGNDTQWQRFCEVLQRSDLAGDPRYSAMRGRVKGRAALISELCRTIIARPAAEWLTLLEARDVPCGPINDYAGVFADPQVRHRGLRVDLRRADGGTAPTLASPLNLADTPPRYDQAPPLLGEHPHQVLATLLGRTDEQIETLRRDGVV